jgi:hypothetical protein
LNGVKRWFKILFLLGVVTIFSAPCDPEDDPTPTVALARAREQRVGFLRIDQTVPQVQQSPQHSLFLASAFGSHFKLNSSIIDLTCARLC